LPGAGNALDVFGVRGCGKPGRVGSHRLWYYPLLITGSSRPGCHRIPALKVVAHRRDERLAALDAVLAEVTPSPARTSPWSRSPGSRENLILLLTAVLLCALIWVFSARAWLPSLRPAPRPLTIYAVGFFGYSRACAGAPRDGDISPFTVPLTVGRSPSPRLTSSRMAATAWTLSQPGKLRVSCYLAVLDRRHAPWRFRLYVVPWLACGCATSISLNHFFFLLVDVMQLCPRAFALWASPRAGRNGPLNPRANMLLVYNLPTPSGLDDPLPPLDLSGGKRHPLPLTRRDSVPRFSSSAPVLREFITGADDFLPRARRSNLSSRRRRSAHRSGYAGGNLAPAVPHQPPAEIGTGLKEFPETRPFPSVSSPRGRTRRANQELPASTDLLGKNLWAWPACWRVSAGS